MTEINPLKAFALNKAIVTLTTGKRNKGPLDPDDVLKVARKFEKYAKAEEKK